MEAQIKKIERPLSFQSCTHHNQITTSVKAKSRSKLQQELSHMQKFRLF